MIAEKHVNSILFIDTFKLNEQRMYEHHYQNSYFLAHLTKAEKNNENHNLEYKQNNVYIKIYCTIIKNIHILNNTIIFFFVLKIIVNGLQRSRFLGLVIA